MCALSEFFPRLVGTTADRDPQTDFLGSHPVIRVSVLGRIPNLASPPLSSSGAAVILVNRSSAGQCMESAAANWSFSSLINKVFTEVTSIDWYSEPYFSGVLASFMLLCMVLPSFIFRAPVPPNQPHLAKPKYKPLPKKLFKVKNPYRINTREKRD